MVSFRLLVLVVIFLTLVDLVNSGVSGNSTCIPDWAQCGGSNWNKSTDCCTNTYYCNYQSEYYSECIPKPSVPFPPAPPSSWCGPEGKALNTSKLQIQGQVSSLDIAWIWSKATDNLTEGHAPGGNITCVQAVIIALGECEHPTQSNWKTINDPVCTLGSGGIWQVTSADSSDRTAAGCNSSDDPCCDARLAYAHSYNQGGAVYVPSDYCSHEEDCTQIYVSNGNGGKIKWNDPSVDALKPNAKIVDCNLYYNPWYSDNGTSLSSVTIDQSPCYFGPFEVAAGGVGREFFPDFYGWGGWFQHYTDSKGGWCDVSPQSPNYCNTTDEKWSQYPTYAELGVAACKAMMNNTELKYY